MEDHMKSIEFLREHLESDSAMEERSDWNEWHEE